MRGRLTQNRVTLRYCGKVTNKERHISTFTRPMYPKLSRVVTLNKKTRPTELRDTLMSWSHDK